MDMKKTIGEALIEARKKRGLSQEQVANEMCLSTDKINQLEALNNSSEVGDVYTRGHLQMYARFLGLPAFLNFNISTDDLKSVQMKNITDEYTHRLIRLWGTLAIVTAILVLFAFWWYEQEWFDTQTLNDTTAVPSEVFKQNEQTLAIPRTLTLPVEKKPAVVEVEPDESFFEIPEQEAPQIPSKERTLKDSNSSENAQEKASPSPASPALVQDRAEVSLRIRSNGRSWIYISDTQSTELINRVVFSGYEVEVQGIPPLDVRLGNGPVISVWVNGKAYDFSRYISSLNTAFFEVPKP